VIFTDLSEVVTFCTNNFLKGSCSKMLRDNGLACMDFSEALELSKEFPSGHPKVFKGFIEWGVWDIETEGYVVITDAKLANEPCSNQLEDYVKSHKLRIGHLKEYLMICSQC
jgi:hypothetical protein